MEKGIYTVTIEDLDVFGDGVSRIEGTPVFIPYALKDEEILCEVIYVKKDFARGKIKKIIKESANRIKPSCPYYYQCGGCSLMHLNYDSQIEYKKEKVIKNFKKIAGQNISIDKIVKSPLVFEYRNKLSLPIRGEVGNVSIGMYRKNTHQVIDMNTCMLSGEWNNKLVNLIREYLNEEKIKPYNEENFKGEIRHVVARFIDDQLLVTLVSNGEYKHSLDSLINKLEKNFNRFGLFVNENTYKNNVILGNVTKHIYGIKNINTICLDTKIVLGPTSFYQINNEIKDLIYSDVNELVKNNNTEVLIDCFSGIGVLTNLIHKENYKSYGIEIEASSVNDANELAKINNNTIKNICGDAEKELPIILKENEGKKTTLILDPPRKGIGENICNVINESGIDNFVYISCDSATLARDIKFLSTKYKIKNISVYDMFPNTEHVETVCFLTKIDPK